MVALVLRWTVPAAPLSLRWRVSDDRSEPTSQPNSETPLAIIIGPPGRDGGTGFSAIAAAALSGHRAVKAVVGGVGYPDIAQPADGDLIVGITTQAADLGASVTVQGSGILVEPSWSWVPGPVFAADLGILTQARPPGAWLRQIGVALAADRIAVDLRPTIQLLN